MKTPTKPPAKPHAKIRPPVKSKTYRASVIKDDGWFIAEVSGLRAFHGGKGGVVTQGRDLDELAYMVREASRTACSLN